jgi:plastocyanin
VKTRVRGVHALVIAALAIAAACGGGSGGPTDPGSGGGGGGGAQSGATITIGANGAVSPAQVTINTGQAVTFVNNSNRTRNVTSDPHPVHTDCPAVNSVNLLAPGQTKQTGAFTTARTCGFHDHDDPDNTAVQGAIVIR